MCAWPLQVKPDCIAGVRCLLGMTAGYTPRSGSGGGNAGSSSGAKVLRQSALRQSAAVAKAGCSSSAGQLGAQGTAAARPQQPTAAAAAVCSTDGRKCSSSADGGGGSAVAAPGSIAAAAIPAPPCAGLARALDALQLWPSAAQLHLVDTKFGGAQRRCVASAAARDACMGCCLQLLLVSKAGATLAGCKAPCVLVLRLRLQVS